MNKIKYRWKNPHVFGNFEIIFGEGDRSAYIDDNGQWCDLSGYPFISGSVFIQEVFEKEYKKYLTELKYYQRERKLKKILNGNK